MKQIPIRARVQYVHIHTQHPARWAIRAHTHTAAARWSCSINMHNFAFCTATTSKRPLAQGADAANRFLFQPAYTVSLTWQRHFALPSACSRNLHASSLPQHNENAANPTDMPCLCLHGQCMVAYMSVADSKTHLSKLLSQPTQPSILLLMPSNIPT